MYSLTRYWYSAAPYGLMLTTDERTELERRILSRAIRSDDARRARVILMLADGASYSTIEQTVPCYRDYINR